MNSLTICFEKKQKKEQLGVTFRSIAAAFRLEAD